MLNPWWETIKYVSITLFFLIIYLFIFPFTAPMPSFSTWFLLCFHGFVNGSSWGGDNVGSLSLKSYKSKGHQGWERQACSEIQSWVLRTCSDRHIRKCLMNSNGIQEQKAVTSSFKNNCLAYLSFFTLTIPSQKQKIHNMDWKAYFAFRQKEKVGAWTHMMI